MKGTLSQVILIAMLLIGSAGFYVGAWGTWDLFYNYPGASRQVTIYMAASGVLLAAALWRIVALIRRARRGSAHEPRSAAR